MSDPTTPEPFTPEATPGDAFTEQPLPAETTDVPEALEDGAPAGRKSRRGKAAKTKEATVKEPKTTSSRGRSSLATAQGWVPTMSSFDYLGNSYRLYRRRRVILLAVIVFLAGAALIVAGRLGVTFWERSGIEAEIDQAEQRQTQTSIEFRNLTGPGGIPVEQMLGQLDARRSAAVTISSGAPDVSGLMSALSTVNVPGVVITGVDMSSTTTTTEKKGASTVPIAPSADGSAAPLPSPSATKATSTAATVTITGTFSDQQALESFSAAIRAIPQLTNVDIKFASGTPGTLTVTANLTPSTARGELLELELGASEFSAVVPNPSADPALVPLPGAPTGGTP